MELGERPHPPLPAPTPTSTANNPVPITLVIGNDGGTTEVVARFVQHGGF